MNEYTLALDLAKAKQRQQQTIFVRQGDKNGTTIVATITDHGVAASTTGLTARFSMRLPDGTHYYRKAASLSGSVATVTLDEAQAASVAGRTDVAYFQLLQDTTVVASTESFTVIVLPDALADADVAESYDSAIQDAIDNANEAADAAWEAAQQTIPDGSVTTVKLASNAVTADKIADAVRNGYVRSFETVADMQAATDLKAGMTCHTNGFHTSGDGGAAYYTVSTSGTANGMDVLALQGGLFAALVVTEPYVTPEQFGAHGDNTHDDTMAIQAAVTSGKNVSFGKQKTYKITSDITFHTSLDLNYSTLSLVGASLVIDDGLSSQNHYGFGITVSNGYMVGDNTNKLIDIAHSTKTSIINIGFKNFLCGIYVGTGYEHNIEDCRFIGNSSVQCTAIEKHDGDGFIRNVTGVDCHKGVVVGAGKHYISNIHFWIHTASLLSGSVMVTYTGAGQSNLTIEYAYIDTYETGIKKSGLGTLTLNNSNIVMATGLLSGDYYLFEFGDTKQNFLVTVNNFSVPWSNESNFKISGTQKALFSINYGKMSYAMKNVVKDYFNSQVSFLNGITVTQFNIAITPASINIKGKLTIPSNFTNSKKALSFENEGIYFPVQNIPIDDGANGNEFALTSGYDLYIQNVAGQSFKFDAVLAYLPQYT